VALANVKREVHDHDVRVHIPVEFPLLWIDGFLFEQVLVNLLENASRYTKSGSLIEVSAHVMPKTACIEIADNGPGLPSESESKVFDKFFRGTTVAPDGRRGVGLGLAICRAIVEAHGGEITAANRSAGGALFRIVLPRDKSAPNIVVDDSPVTVSA
jgi:two-component system sensor histidine kinase KdpD